MRRETNSLAIFLILLLLLFFLVDCRKESTTETEQSTEIEGLYGGAPNPAAVYCEGLGYEYEIRTSPSGGQYGVCVFPDGSECRGWLFLRGKCGQKFSFCEKKGFTIENRAKNMGTWTAEYAVCVFPDRSECPEWDFFQGTCKSKTDQGLEQDK